MTICQFILDAFPLSIVGGSCIYYVIFKAGTIGKNPAEFLPFISTSTLFMVVIGTDILYFLQAKAINTLRTWNIMEFGV